MASVSTRPPLVFWFGSPPVVERGVPNALSNSWGAEVAYVFTTELREERRAMGWDDGRYGAATLIELPHDLDVAHQVDSVIERCPGAIHIVGGFAGPVGPYLEVLSRSIPRDRLAVFSERPGVYGSRWRALARRLGLGAKYRRIRRRFEPRVGLILPLGAAGEEAFARYGWPSTKTQRFMYCPELDESSPASVESTVAPVAAVSRGHSPSSEPTRFVYVGRYSSTTKGVDTLVKAFDLITPEGWTLDLIGGYGDMTDVIARWARERPSVRDLGVVPTAEIVQVLSGYDVAVVPSRFDGWNVVVNEALAAGIGVIATDQAVSHELVQLSGAGVVVSADSPGHLAAGLRSAIGPTRPIEAWKSAARSYQSTITARSVADYLAETIDSVLLSDGRRPPGPPWAATPASASQRTVA